MIRVLLADDEGLIRDALATLLALEDDIDVVTVAASASEAIAAARKHSPDVAVLDLQMPEPRASSAPEGSPAAADALDGIDAAEAIGQADPRCACVIVTSHARPGYLRRALERGVRGFLPKTISAKVLADVIRQVHDGGRYVDPELAAAAITSGDSPLTARETDVLDQAAGGAPVEEIARLVHLAPGTVRNHLSAAVAKLGVSNRHEAVHAARSRGWI